MDIYAHALVLLDDVSSFASLQPAASCTSKVVVSSILAWVLIC